MKPDAIIVNNIEVKQGSRTILSQVNFSLAAGEHLAILGGGGAGKTTLARVLAGLQFAKGTITYKRQEEPVSPKITFMAASETWKNRSNVSDFYYQQRFNSCDAEDADTVLDSLGKSGCNIAGIPTLLERFDLSHRANTPLIQLSNGEQKKLQLIRHLSRNADVLIIDQPFIGLDTASAKALDKLLNELAAHSTLILVTDHKHIPECITHIAELQNGQLAGLTTREDFHPLEDTAADFALDEMQLLHHGVQDIPVIEMEHVTIKHGEKKLLDGINWTVYAGEGWLIRGHNGAGKSTLLSLVTADNPQAYSQQIRFFGKQRGSGESIWDIKKRVGLVSPELYKYFDRQISVYHAIGSGFFDTIGLFRTLTASQHHEVLHWMEVMELADKKDYRVAELSDSQQRWVLIARAMVKSPAILALDEPCQGLDAVQTRRFLNLVTRIHETTGVTVLYVSHYAGEVPGTIKNILELEQGKIKFIHQPQKEEAFA